MLSQEIRGRLINWATALLMLFVVVRTAWMVRLFTSNSLLAHANWVAFAATRTAVGLLVVAVAVAAVTVLMRLGRCLPGLHPTPLVLACAGWGALLLLAAHDLGVDLSPLGTKTTLVLPVGVLVGLLALSRRRHGRQGWQAQQISDAAMAGSGEQWPPAVRAALLGLTLLFCLWLADALFWLCTQKAPAIGDELSFWWSSLDHLERNGFAGYMQSFPRADYTPGYPVIASFLLVWVPEGLLTYAQPAVPFLFGLMLLAMLFSFGRPGGLRVERIGISALLAYALFFQHIWIHSMIFKLWYGEAMAIASTASVFLLLHPFLAASSRGRTGGEPSRTSNMVVFFQLFGLAAIARLSKPPLSILLVPVVICGLAALGLALLPRGRRSAFMLAIATLLGGALSAQFLWGNALAQSARHDFYGVPVSAFLALDWHGAVSRLVPYFLQSYKTVWIVFLFTAVIALAARPREYAPPLLAGLGLTLAVFFLYLTFWHQVEHESGARYVLHGLYGWVLFFLATWGGDLVDRTDQLLRRMRPRLRGGTTAASGAGDEA